MSLLICFLYVTGENPIFATDDALQDIRSMKLLESYIGHNAVVKIIEDCAGMEIRMNSYPKKFFISY